ncbi:MAG: hypothetical protein R3E10_11865 [Gemmatimonadota bacterium]
MTYERPELEVFGGLRDLTQVGHSGAGDMCTVISAGRGKAVGNPHCQGGGTGTTGRS